VLQQGENRDKRDQFRRQHDRTDGGSSELPQFQFSWSRSSATLNAFSRIFLPLAVTSQRMRYDSPQASPVRTSETDYTEKDIL